jgi:DNA repair exonuclease SbcCD ATPase subunit
LIKDGPSTEFNLTNFNKIDSREDRNQRIMELQELLSEKQELD